MNGKSKIEEAAERIVALEAELETSGETATGDEALDFSRAVLRQWVETVVGVVTSPGVGRVTLIHANGTQTKIASPELPFLLSKPVRFSD